MARLVYETTDIITDDTLKSEDGGMALIHEDSNASEPVGDGHVFVRLQSWDDDSKHPLLRSLVGKTVRISVEVLD